MTYRVLATDYDGTLAHDGVVDDATLNAIRAARDRRLRLVMVTGRELADLFNTFEHVHLFDRIVAENGAVLYNPETKVLEPLAAPPPQALLDVLQRNAVPISVGHSIVATVEPHDQALLAAIRDLGLEWHVTFNKGSVMALPAGVTKATGLTRALGSVGATAQETVGVGDAENDQAFLRMCGLAVAVDNALPSVKALADVVTAGARGAGVTELLARLLDGSLENAARRAGPTSVPSQG